MEAKTELMQAVEKLMLSATFSPEAVRAVSELTEKAAQLEARLKDRDERLADERENNKVGQREIQRLMTKLSDAENKVAALTAQLEAGRDDRAKAETANAVAAAYKDAMEIVFKPNTVRESIQKMVPVATSSGSYDSMGRMSGSEYVTQYPQTENVTRTEG